MRLKNGIVLMIVIGINCACSEKSDYVEPVPEIIVVTATNGVGDNGYNDQILSGIMQVNETEDIRLSLVSPESIDEAENILESWSAKESSGERSLLVLASNEYESLVNGFDDELPDNRHILLFESEALPLCANVSSFIIRRYGASYLAGCMASDAESACVMAAMKSSDYINDAVEGFADGYHTGGNDAEILYLAEDESGFAMPVDAYRMMQDIDYNAFIYPLAGGSNNGVYKFTREMTFCLQLVAGMDVDCSYYSTRVPFSVIIDIRHVVVSLLREWIGGGQLQKHYIFDMSDDDIVSVIVSPDFYQDCITWEDWYDHPDYWGDVYQRYMDVAIAKEEEYYEDR